MTEALTAIFGNAALLGAVILIVKLWLETSLKNSSVQFEKSLDAANNREIERLRTELRIAEGRTTRFDERRFEALNDVYSGLAEVDDAFRRWTRPMRLEGAPSEADDGKVAVEAYDRFMRSLNQNRLWLGKDLATAAENVRNALHEAWADFVDRDDRDWKKVRDIMSNQVPTLRNAFEERAERLLTNIEERSHRDLRDEHMTCEGERT